LFFPTNFVLFLVDNSVAVLVYLECRIKMYDEYTASIYKHLHNRPCTVQVCKVASSSQWEKITWRMLHLKLVV